MKQSDTIHLGFEVGTGEPVSIPLKHMVVTGQTQESGKTTTLEALIDRSQRRALTFVTKPGEGSFASAARIQPYFREQTDWKYVAAILEASRGEKLKWERAWIIRASKGARTLADVQQNVRTAMEKARGQSESAYLCLDAYLDEVVPLIGQVTWAKTVQLSTGVNVMDLEELNIEMQHLIIRSSIEWMLKNEQDSLIVVPEAWKFIPQGRGTPVKLAAESFIRQAAGMRNYLWLDSQDIAGVDKIILKSVPVWVLGVQRESNEIDRTLDQIPAGVKKPKPEQIATLGLGQFFACWGTNVVKVYVQPAWMDAGRAKAVAMGDSTPEPRQQPTIRKEPVVNESEARELRRENADLKTELHNLQVSIERMRGMQPAPRESAAMPFDQEAIYQAFKRRLTDDAPGLIRVLTNKPEMEVIIERPTIEAEAKSLFGRTAHLIAKGWFKEPKTNSTTVKELGRTGRSTNTGNLSRELGKLVELGFLTDEADGYREVPGMKVRIKEA